MKAHNWKMTVGYLITVVQYYYQLLQILLLFEEEKQQQVDAYLYLKEKLGVTAVLPSFLPSGRQHATVVGLAGFAVP